MRAIVTVAIGSEWENIFALSNPTVVDWARRIGADRPVIIQPKFLTQIRAYEKLQIRDMLDRYDRIVVVDADILISPNAPDVFDEVPSGWWGARRTHVGDKKLERTFAEHAAKLMLPPPSRVNQYFDTGLFVCDRSHRSVLCDPPRWVHAFYEQTYLNLRVLEENVPFCDLGFKWNCFETKLSDQAFAIHFKRSLWRKEVKKLLDAMQSRLEIWKH